MLPQTPTATFPFRILMQVGEGAMGEVYRAEDVELGRHVAIKIVKPAFLASLSEHDAHDAVQRFLQEARAAAALSHPGVTQVHRVGTEGGTPYIAMEWLDGQTFDAVLRKQPRLSMEQAAWFGLEVLSVLEATHRAGIVHRDIKPANLMVTRDRRIKVTDFGVARVQGSSLAHTHVGLVLGTPAYAAPEQLAGEVIDHRIDLYALGAVLYQAVVGNPPFEARSVTELAIRVQTVAVTPPSALVPGLPPSFDDFMLRALAKRPDDRFPSAAEMARALQPFLAPSASSSIGGAANASNEPRTETLRSHAVVVAADSSRRQTPANAPAPTTPLVALATTTTTTTAGGLVRGLVSQWPAHAVGRMSVERALDKLLERPLHAAPFCGGVVIGDVVLLICDGVLIDAITDDGLTGDLAMARLPVDGACTLHACPPALDPRVVPLLSAVAAPGQARLADLDAAFVDVPRLAARLAREGFDGVIRLRRGEAHAALLFRRGARVLDVFDGGWPAGVDAVSWMQWIGQSGAVVAVEDRRPRFPAATFRRLLRDVRVEVERPADEGQIRQDTAARSAALTLRLSGDVGGALHAVSTAESLVAADPATALVRWFLADVESLFEQFQRTARWRSMLEVVPEVAGATLHPTLTTSTGLGLTFDAATVDAAGHIRHVVERVADGSPEAVASFIARVEALREARGLGSHLVGAVLVAPRFSEAALEVYLQTLSASRRTSLKAAMDLFTHREGHLVTKGGLCHVLLVEEQEGRRRPLVLQD